MCSSDLLVVWQKSMELVKAVYELVRLLPKSELFCLSDQMRRSSVSIPSNIAEGQGRHSAKEFARFLLIALGSQAELETQLEICIMLNYLTKDQINHVVELCAVVGKMLKNLYRSITNN